MEYSIGSLKCSLLSAVVVTALSGCGGDTDPISISSEDASPPEVSGSNSDTQPINTSFAVNASAGNGGSISPSVKTITSGDAATFTVTPDASYSIENVTGCNGLLSGNTYTTGSITSDCSVSASFVSVNYHISTATGAGGNITPSSTTVEHGASTSFIISADDGYTISGASGCGGTLTGNTYVTGSITGDCSIISLFNNGSSVESKSFLQSIADGDIEPVIIDGQEWSFRTPPPPENERTVRVDHPRLLMTSDSLAEIKSKLQDPVYKSIVSSIEASANKGDMLENAFLYQLTGDLSRANIAKQALLNYSGTYGEQIIFGYDKMSNMLGPVLVFDWIMDTLSSDEKLQIFTSVKDNFKYNHQTANPVHHNGNGPGTYPWYWNNVYNRLPELYLPALAFAITDEGIDDTWANEVIAWAYDEDETRVVGPYGPNHGAGFLDILMTISLDTGGASGTASYYNYWAEVLHAIAFWETATGQPMWSKAPFMEKGPQALLTSRESIRLGDTVMSAIEFITGVSSNADTAALAKYVVEYFGASDYHKVYRAILGDLRVTAKSPAELNIPTAKYVRGDHVFYSKSSWDEDNSVSLYVRSPYINAGRGVGSAGVFAIDKGRKHIAPRVIVSKTHAVAGFHSGMWIYDPTDTSIDVKHIAYQSKGTYWSGNRSYDAWTTVSQSKYFEGGPEIIDINGSYRAVSMEYSQRYDKIDVRTARRTIVHIPDGERNFIVVYDYVDASSALKTAWQMRLMEEPSVSGSEFSLTGLMNATVVSPQNHTLEWLGGTNKEFVTPSPEQMWYTNRKGGTNPGYSSDPKYLAKYGLGNIYIQPPEQRDASSPPYTQQSEYLVVIEMSEMTPVTVTRISDRETEFDRWNVQFSPDGAYSITQK